MQVFPFYLMRVDGFGTVHCAGLWGFQEKIQPAVGTKLKPPQLLENAARRHVAVASHISCHST